MRASRIGLTIGALAAIVLATLMPGPVAAESVSKPPATWTPSLATGGADGTVEEIRQLVPCGGMMYAVGKFTKIKQGGITYDRNQAFSFNATTGAVSDWNPNVTSEMNPEVHSIALSADCGTAYLGGRFSMVGGVNATNIAAVSTSTSLLIPGFAHTANRQVSALLMSGSHLLVGGYFTAINGSSRGYFASLNPITGADDGYVNLNISGNYLYTDDDGASTSVKSNPTRVWNFSLSPDTSRLLAMGVFTSVGGQARRQIFMLDLNPLSADLNPWYSAEFNQYCDVVQPFWLQDAAWAPDGSKIYIATTGFRPANGAGHSVVEPRAGLCDAAAAYTVTAPATRLWLNYTGCDSLLSIAADQTMVYVGGHHRWMSNPLGCGFRGTGSADSPGMAGLSPTNGAVTFNPTRSRGEGATDMLITPAGLWIASDNKGASTQCAGLSGYAGLCFLPKAKGTALTDYNDDGRADNAVWRPSNGTWYVMGSAAVPWGQSGDVRQVGNFAGSANLDPTVWRPSNGTWYVHGVPGGTPWGASSDKPVAGDYDGDDLTDFAVWRPSNGTWYVHGGPPTGTPFGASTDIPVPGDYNGDDKTDLAVWRPSNGTWYVRANGVNQTPVVFGGSGDKPIVADFINDGKADYTVFRPSNGTWYTKGGGAATPWGFGSDIPVAGDFTGDGKADIAVWRPVNGHWFVRGDVQTPWGKAGDVPLHAFP